MTTLNQFIESTDHQKLAKAVINQSGGWTDFKEKAIDVSEHGAEAGFSGWTYYTETGKFFRKNCKLITAFANEQADMLGDASGLNMIMNFTYMKQHEITMDELANALYNPDASGDAYDLIANCMAWYVLEEFSRLYTDLLENE